MTSKIVTVSLQSPREFLYDDESKATAGTRWSKWIRDFETFIVGSGIENDGQIKAILLHVVGDRAADIYATLGKPATDSYGDVKAVFETHFKPMKNLAYEVFMFGEMRQKEQESLDDFVVRLRAQAVLCEFSVGEIDKEIIRMVIRGCKSVPFKEKILREKATVTLD